MKPNTFKLLSETDVLLSNGIESIKDFDEKREYTEYFLRRLKTDPKKREYILNEFPDKCQLCGNVTFEKENNKHYFEVHHIIPLSDNGEDKEENLSKLCPNCHRKAHYGKNKEKTQKDLLNYTKEILENLKK